VLDKLDRAATRLARTIGLDGVEHA
jgi:hypothetical protein